jgi:hypothetical protein
MSRPVLTNPLATPPTVAIVKVKRRMRGGSQAFLVQGSDGNHYVAKFTNNPQGSRTLINEWICYRLLKQLNIKTPECCVLEFTAESLDRQSLFFETGSKKIYVEGRRHFGSRMPVDPEKDAIYDFLPLSVMGKISNLADFAAIFVADRWFGQQDQRQAIFVRDARCGDKLSFKALMIDHGMSFGGPHWSFVDAARQGLYRDKAIYSMIDMPALCRDAASRIATLDLTHLRSLLDDMPSDWLAPQDRPSLNQLIANLQRRQSQIGELAERHLRELFGLTLSTPSELALVPAL